MDSFVDLFSHAARTTKEEYERKLLPYGVHAGQQFLLELLWANPDGLTIGEIAESLGVEAPSITRTVQRMARQALVEKFTGQEDARQVVVRTTAKGWQLKEIIPRIMAETEAKILTNVSEIERALFLRILAQIIQNTEQ